MIDLKIYHFFCCGELIETIDARTPEDACSRFKKWGYTESDCSCVLEYSRKTGKYTKLNKSTLGIIFR